MLQLLRTASAIASYCVNYCVNHQAAPLWAEGCGESHHHNCEAKGVAAGGPRSLRSFTSPGEKRKYAHQVGKLEETPKKEIPPEFRPPDWTPEQRTSRNHVLASSDYNPT
jgi:hypothetical protein